MSWRERRAARREREFRDAVRTLTNLEAQVASGRVTLEGDAFRSAVTRIGDRKPDVRRQAHVLDTHNEDPKAQFLAHVTGLQSETPWSMEDNDGFQ